MTTHILNLSCPDRKGIVAGVASALHDSNCNIEEASQFHEKQSNRFFMRVVFSAADSSYRKAFENMFTEIARKYKMDWQIFDANKPVHAIIMVSKADHCLNDILYRWRTHQLNLDIKAILSNHKNNEHLAKIHDIPFHHIPVDKSDKSKAEKKLRDIIKKTDAELIVLARYMQILSKDITQEFANRIINIHHSFLPGFKGAKPYHQAYNRGVKLIGATAHFATSDLDEGPIIEQKVERIDHTYSPEMLQLRGQEIESGTLSAAIRLYAERRIFVHANRTIIL